MLPNSIANNNSVPGLCMAIFSPSYCVLTGPFFCLYVVKQKEGEEGSRGERGENKYKLQLSHGHIPSGYFIS